MLGLPTTLALGWVAQMVGPMVADLSRVPPAGGFVMRPAPATIRSPSSLLCAAATLPWDRSLWDATSWEDSTNFEKHQLLQGLLDGDVTWEGANHVAWRAMGYTLVDSQLVDPSGAECCQPPDVLSDESWLKRCEATLPLEDEDEMEQLNVLVNTLHGETLTKTLVAEHNRDFLARRMLVWWLYLKDPSIRAS